MTSILAHAIDLVLRDARGERLSKLQIAHKLGLPTENNSQSREAMNAFGHELFLLAHAGTIQMAYPNAARPEFNFWIEAPLQPRAEASVLEARP